MEINEGWKNITLKKYLQYVEYFNDIKDDSNVNLRLLSFLEEEDYQKLFECPISILNIKLDKWLFLQEDFLNLKNTTSPVLDVGGGIVYIINKNFNLLTFEQWENMDSILKASEVDKNYLKNIHKLIAISSMIPTEYKYDKAMEIAELILNESMYDIIPNLVFFLNNEQGSSINMLSYFRTIQDQKILEIEDTLKRLEDSIKNGVGMGLWYHLRTRILLSLMRFWLKVYKQRSLISLT